MHLFKPGQIVKHRFMDTEYMVYNIDGITGNYVFRDLKFLTNTEFPQGTAEHFYQVHDVHSTPVQSIHIHKWVKYIGFTDIYDFCDTCGEKFPDKY
jgi:hypothetical protein